MSALRWFERCGEVLERIRATQLEAIERAATLIAEAAERGGGLHFFDTAHCSREPIHRAGGLYMLAPLTVGLNLNSRPALRRAEQVESSRREGRAKADERLAQLGVARSGLAEGDVLICNSVSGRSALAVEVARAASQMGVRVVAITSLNYSKGVSSQHSTGKRLYEVAEVVIDNCGIVGDAVLDMEGVDTRVAPTSGVAFCFIIWALISEAVARMTARGLKPHVYRSINLPGGAEFNARAEAEYRETGI